VFYTEAVLRLVEEKEVGLDSRSSPLTQLETIKRGEYARFIHCLPTHASLR